MAITINGTSISLGNFSLDLSHTGVSVSNSGSLTALGGFTAVPAYVGTDYGYTSGGVTSAPQNVNTIDEFPFSTPFATATDVGDIIESRNNSSGHSSSTDGYVSGGGSTDFLSFGRNTIDKFPFSTPFVTATNVVGSGVPLTAARTSHSTSTDAFTSGGRYYPPTGSPIGLSNTYQYFPFSSPTAVFTFASTLTASKTSAAGQTSTTDGFSSGGLTTPPTTTISVIEKFPFSSPFAAGTNIGAITQARGVMAGISSPTDGYTCGGVTPTITNTIDRFPFSTPFATATDVGDTLVAQSARDGLSTISTGYITGGGPNPPVINNITSFPFSTPFTTATDVADLSQTRWSSCNQFD